MARLASVFSSHMVFAARKPIRIYGEGQGEISITFAGRQISLSSSSDRWFAEFPPMEYGGPYCLTVVLDGKREILEDIYVGEVLLMAGQSNMQFKLRESSFPKEDIRGDGRMRLFTAPRPEEGEPFSPADGWRVCTAENAPQWSALAYHVGQFRTEANNIAVGLICCYQGASVIESWVPEGTFGAVGISLSDGEKYGDHFHEKYRAWNGDGYLYSHSLSTLFPFSLSAVVWYQGESDASLAESRVYGAELKELIRVWRDSFSDASLPFVVVQIADYINRAGEPWKNIQKAQYDIQFETCFVKTARSADVCENDNIHPPTKVKLAARIAETLESML